MTNFTKIRLIMKDPLNPDGAEEAIFRIICRTSLDSMWWLSPSWKFDLSPCKYLSGIVIVLWQRIVLTLIWYLQVLILMSTCGMWAHGTLSLTSSHSTASACFKKRKTGKEPRVINLCEIPTIDLTWWLWTVALGQETIISISPQTIQTDCSTFNLAWAGSTPLSLGEHYYGHHNSSPALVFPTEKACTESIVRRLRARY